MGEQRAKRFLPAPLRPRRLSRLVPSVAGRFGAGVTAYGVALPTVMLEPELIGCRNGLLPFSRAASG